MVVRSMGNTPARAPHSVVMLAIAKRSSTGRSVTPSPVNSQQWFKTSSLLKKPHRAIIMSLPVTPGCNFPWNSILATGGTCHQVCPVAHKAAASVRTTGVPKQPTPPYIFE
eukprot:Lithocolla_globosa_v1_NODE_202_length_5196_cov_7.727290.p3 type:complete len:111 gc:universal NODE_202_length_5196_cov_7.727290:1754-2086(+)